MKKLYKSRHDKVFSGVIGGLGEYYETDAVLLRLAFLLVVIITGVFPGLIAYIVASIIVPNRPYHESTKPNEPPQTETKTEESTEK